MKRKTFLPLTLLLAIGACSNDESTGSLRTPLKASCAARPADVPADGWVCGESRTVECNAARTAVDTIYVTPADAVCEGREFRVSNEGPFAVGTYDITVTGAPTAEGGDPPTCASTLVVIDTAAPAVTAHTTELWPPNHKYRTVTTSDCVTVADACDEKVSVYFTYAASDEPRNDTGDGNTEEDVRFGCDAVELRSERKGNGDARVYTLGFRAVDASGNATDGTCRVVVAHDQGKKKEPLGGPEAYRVTGPASCAPAPAPQPEPEPTPAPTPQPEPGPAPPPAPNPIPR